jgi:hypothetical protein
MSKETMAAWLEVASDADVQQRALETEDYLHANGFDCWTYGNNPDPQAIRRQLGKLNDALDAEIARRQPPPPPPPDPAEEWMARKAAERAAADRERAIEDMAELFAEDPQAASRLWDEQNT